MLIEMFQDRLEQAWGFYHSDENDEAKKTAAKLISEPHLGPLHQVSMHMLFGTTGLDPDAPHNEAARIYNHLLERQDLSGQHRDELEENHAISEDLIGMVTT